MGNINMTARVTKVRMDIYKIGTYFYHVSEMESAGMIGILALIPIFQDVEEGDYIQSSKYELTQMEGIYDEEMVIKFDKLTVIPKEKYIQSKYLVIECYGLYTSSDIPTMKYVGPTRKPLHLSTLKLRDENGKFSYPILLASFCKNATELIKVPKQTKLEVVGCLHNMKYKKGYEINVSSFKIIGGI